MTYLQTPLRVHLFKRKNKKKKNSLLGKDSFYPACPFMYYNRRRKAHTKKVYSFLHIWMQQSSAVSSGLRVKSHRFDAVFLTRVWTVAQRRRPFAMQGMSVMCVTLRLPACISVNGWPHAKSSQVNTRVERRCWLQREILYWELWGWIHNFKSDWK